MLVHVAFTPDEGGAAPTGIVIDVIRATSTMCQALSAGYERVFCTAEVEDARAYWQHTDGSAPVDAKTAFDQYWFGARSLARVEVLLANFRQRFDAYPPSLSVLHRWAVMSPDSRRLICHWHLQLSDPIYRAFTGTFLVERRSMRDARVDRDVVLRWVRTQFPERWSETTCAQFASKLLSAASEAGLVSAKRDPRKLLFPKVPDLALTYLLYLLRNTRF